MPGVRYPIEMVKGVPVVVAPQEIDASNAGWLQAVLLETAARGHATFVVDITRTQFCDSAGLGVLVRAQAGPGRRRRAAAGHPRQRRSSARLRPHRHRPRHPKLHQPGRSPGTGTGRRSPATAPATAPQAGMRTPADRLPPDPGARTSPA